MIKNSKLVILRVSNSRLLKLEVPELAENVIGIVSNHDPELLQIEAVFDLLVNKQSEISKLKAPYGVDPIRWEQQLLHEKLRLDVGAIKLHLKMLRKTNDKKDLHLVETVINRYFTYLYKNKNDKEVNQRVEGFLDDVKTDEEVSTAFNELGFTTHVDTLTASLSKVRRVSSKRVSKLAQRPGEATSELTKSVLDSIEDLFKEIEVAQLRNPEADYVPLVNELNVLMYKYKESINLRQKFNERKAAEKKGNEADNGVENDAETEVPRTEVYGVFGKSANGNISDIETPSMNGDSQSISNTENLALNEKSGNGRDKDFDLSLDQKEAAAMSSKALQLPQVNDDDDNVSK